MKEHLLAAVLVELLYPMTNETIEIIIAGI